MLNGLSVGGDNLEARKAQENKIQREGCRSVVPSEARRLEITLWRLKGTGIGGGIAPGHVAGDGHWNKRLWVKVEYELTGTP